MRKNPTNIQKSWNSKKKYLGIITKSKQSTICKPEQQWMSIMTIFNNTVTVSLHFLKAFFLILQIDSKKISTFLIYLGQCGPDMPLYKWNEACRHQIKPACVAPGKGADGSPPTAPPLPPLLPPGSASHILLLPLPWLLLQVWWP